MPKRCAVPIQVEGPLETQPMVMVAKMDAVLIQAKGPLGIQPLVNGCNDVCRTYPGERTAGYTTSGQWVRIFKSKSTTRESLSKTTSPLIFANRITASEPSQIRSVSTAPGPIHCWLSLTYGGPS